jgi:hypothetical protein
MSTKYVMAALIAFLFPLFGAGKEPDVHRILVLDAMRKDKIADNCEILLMEVESGKILSRKEIGFNPDICLSQKGDTLAILTNFNVGGIGQPETRLEFVRTTDLSLLEQGLVRVDRGATMRGPTRPDSALSPNADEVIVPWLGSARTDEKPLKRPYNSTLLSRVKRELDKDGFFKVVQPKVVVPRGQGLVFLRLADWPRILLWDQALAVIQQIDLTTGAIDNTLRLGAFPPLDLVDPKELEKPIGNLDFRLGSQGTVCGEPSGRYAYYIPRVHGEPDLKPGRLMKIDLAVSPPKVIREGKEPQPDLYGISAISEPGHAIFALKYKTPPGKSYQPSNELKIFSSLDLNFQDEIKISLRNVDSLRASWDGRYMYALDPDEAKLSVISIATGKEIKVLDNIGKVPTMVLALPEVN